MASVKKNKGKTVTTFKITVTTGRDAQGKQRRFYKTFIPPEGLTAKQAEKAAKQAAAEFEKEIELGYHLTADQTFEKYAWYVIQLKERNGLAAGTLEMYEGFMKRIVPAFGFMKLGDIRPQHLNNFYQELRKPGSKIMSEVARPKIDFRKFLKDRGMNQAAFTKNCHVSWGTAKHTYKGEQICRKAAKRIAKFFEMNVNDLFQMEQNDDTLSLTTVRRYHGFISVVFAQAEKEMLISYNPAARVTLPKSERKDPNYFQPEDISRIMGALEKEDIMHRTMIHLFIVTGCRRGEIAGLKWEKIDFDNRKIKIDSALTFTARNGLADGPTKTRNTRTIMIPEETV